MARDESGRVLLLHIYFQRIFFPISLPKFNGMKFFSCLFLHHVTDIHLYLYMFSYCYYI